MCPQINYGHQSTERPAQDGKVLLFQPAARAPRESLLAGKNQSDTADLSEFFTCMFVSESSLNFLRGQ